MSALPTSPPTLFMIALLVLGGSPGCRAGAKEARVASLAGLQVGWSAHQVDDYFTVRGAHQFTARENDQEILCLDYGRGFYCIFTDGALNRVVERPEVETITTSYDGAVWEKPLPVDPEKRLRRTLDAPDLLGRVEHVYPPSTRPASEKGLFSGQFGPAVLLIAPMYAAATPCIFVGATRAAGVSERYNGRKVSLGMSQAEIVRILGQPKYRRSVASGRLLCVYGEKTWVIDETDPWFPWMCIEFENGLATRVFSHGFFDARLQPQKG